MNASPAEPGNSATSATESSRSATRPVIVCIDDELIILESLRRQLFNSVGNIMSIEVASDGEEGLELIAQLVRDGRHIPIVISDYIMPGPSFDELLTRIHQLTPLTQIVVLSGQADRTIIEQARAEGRLHAFVAKPWFEAGLLRTIRGAAPALFA